MRLIDKLISPPQDKYTLLPLDLNYKIPILNKLTSPRSGEVISFIVENDFIRVLVKNVSGKFNVYEKVYTNSESLEQKLQDIETYLKNKYENIEVLKIGTYVPTRHGIIRLHTFPKNLKKSEVLKALELYIQEEIAEIFPDKEIIYSYSFLPSKKDEPYKVIVSVVESSFINTLVNWASSINLNLKIISYEPICILNFSILRHLPNPFTIIHTEYNKVLILTYSKNRLNYETFPYSLNPSIISTDNLDTLIWDLRNYIVLNDLNNIYLSGLALEYTHLIEFFLERLPIFGLLTLDNIPERYSLLYTLSERLVHV